MPRLLPLFLLCLTLLTAACKKDKAEPEPELEGRWNFKNSTISRYTLDGTLIEALSLGPPFTYLVISADAFGYHRLSDNLLFTTLAYTRQGNHIDYTAPAEHDTNIAELTEQELTLRYDKKHPTQEGYYIKEIKYTR